MSRFFSSVIAMRPYYRIFRLTGLKFVPAIVRGPYSLVRMRADFSVFGGYPG